jgi:hypothetical protein
VRPVGLCIDRDRRIIDAGRQRPVPVHACFFSVALALILGVIGLTRAVCPGAQLGDPEMVDVEALPQIKGWLVIGDETAARYRAANQPAPEQ